MGISFQTAPSSQVNQRNTLGVLYLTGNENTDSSIRLSIASGVPELQERISGAWEQKVVLEGLLSEDTGMRSIDLVFDDNLQLVLDDNLEPVYGQESQDSEGDQA